MQTIIDKDYVQVPGRPYYVRKDIYSSYLSDSRDDFSPLEKGRVVLSNDMKSSSQAHTYKVAGVDPYVVYKFSRPMPVQEVRKLAFDMRCVGAPTTEKYTLQVFWSTAKKGFNEGDSIKFLTGQGAVVVDMKRFGFDADSADVVSMRLDLVDSKSCPVIFIDNFELGTDKTGN